MVRAMRSFWSGFRKKTKALSFCRRGATAVEFGIVFPLFLIMTLGIMEMSRAMWIKASMQYAVERTARYYMVNNSASIAVLTAYANAELDAVGVTYNVTFLPILDATTTPNTMTVTGSYDFQVLATIVPFPDVTLTAQSSVRKNS